MVNLTLDYIRELKLEKKRLKKERRMEAARLREEGAKLIQEQATLEQQVLCKSSRKNKLKLLPLEDMIDNLLYYKVPLLNGNRDTTLYYLDFGEFSKIGITKRTVEDRFRGYDLEYRVLDQLKLTEVDARFLEKKLLGMVDKALALPKEHPMVRLGGYTECFHKDSRTSFISILESLLKCRSEVRERRSFTPKDLVYSELYSEIYSEHLSMAPDNVQLFNSVKLTLSDNSPPWY